MTVYDKFVSFVCEVFEVDINDLTDDKTPDDIENWNSVSHMELMDHFEETFSIELDIEDITEMDSIGAMKKILKQYGVDL